jgi:HK97 family phage portal protein
LRWYDPIYRVLGEAVPAADMVHIRRFTMPGEPWGLSPIKQAASAIGLSLSAEEYGYRYFREASNPSGVLSTDQHLDEAAIERQQKNWISSHQGRRMPAILTGGLKWSNLSVSPEESQFLSTRSFQRSEIMMMFGVPPHLLGDQEKSTSWGSGISEQNLGFVTHTLRPWTACIESVFSNLLPRGQFIRFDFSAMLRGDIVARYEAYDKALHSAWMSPNEIRAHEELEPIEGGDTYLQPVTLAPLGFIPHSGPGTEGGAPDTPGQTEPKPQKVTPKVPSKTVSGGENSDPVRVLDW